MFFSCWFPICKFFGRQPPIYIYVFWLSTSYIIVFWQSTPINKSSAVSPNLEVFWLLTFYIHTPFGCEPAIYKPCAASCGFYRLAESCQQVAECLLISSSHSKPVKIRLVTTWYLQTCCKLFKQLASSLWIKIWQSVWSMPVDNLQQICDHQAGASNANALFIIYLLFY